MSATPECHGSRGSSVSGAPLISPEVISLLDDDEEETSILDENEEDIPHMYDCLIDLTSDDEDAPPIELTDDGSILAIPGINTDDTELVSGTDPEQARWGADPSTTRRKARKPKKAYVAFEPRVRPVEIFILEGCNWEDVFLVPGDVVELHKDIATGFECGDFLKIHQVYEDVKDDVYLRGTLFRRSRTLLGMLPRKVNEVYQVLQHNLEDPRDVVTQSLHDVPISFVLRTRTLWHTNRPFPQESFRTTPGMLFRSSEVYDMAPLTCRWKRIFHYSCASYLETGHPYETSLERVSEIEADPGRSVPDVVLRKAVEMMFPYISSSNYTKELATTIEHLCLGTAVSNSISRPVEFADFFCGGGGISVGAKRAGFELKYGVDHNKQACATMRLNHPDMQIYEESIYDWLTNDMRIHAHVRCCHFSTVCKTISPAYTVRGKNHDANEATLYCISDILRKATPMVATLEQTFGATGPNKRQILNAFVLQFTDLDYGVKWAVKNFSEYGVPQERKRLLMIGACPGHPLPEFPAPTHGPGLKRFATIADAIGPVRMGMSNHEPSQVIAREHLPYNPRQFLAGCITTSGGIGNYHPNGSRDFTGREFACLQTFPLDYEFAGTRKQVVEQVGNAVPPIVSEKLFRSVLKTLDKVDIEDAEYEQKMKKLRELGADQDTPIILEPDSDDEMDIEPKEDKDNTNTPVSPNSLGVETIIID